MSETENSGVYLTGFEILQRTPLSLYLPTTRLDDGEKLVHGQCLSDRSLRVERRQTKYFTTIPVAVALSSFCVRRIDVDTRDSSEDR